MHNILLFNSLTTMTMTGTHTYTTNNSHLPDKSGLTPHPLSLLSASSSETKLMGTTGIGFLKGSMPLLSPNQ